MKSTLNYLRFEFVRSKPIHRLADLLLFQVFFCLFFFPSSQVIASDSFKIAAIFAETGIGSTGNEEIYKMIRLAVEEINTGGGMLGQQLEIILIDNKSTPIGSVLAAQKAIELDVVAVIGPLWSSHALAMAPILQKAGIPMITPASTNPDVTIIGDYIFRACFVDSFQGVAMAQFARKDLGADTAIIISNIDEKYSTMLAEYFKDGFIRSSGKVEAEYGYRGNATDFADIIKKISGIQPDVIYIPGYARDSGLFIKQARKLGITATFLGGDGWDQMATYASRYMNGSYQTAAWHPDVPFQKSLELLRLYKKKYEEEIASSLSPLTYDAVMLLNQAITQCQCTERKNIRDSLASIKNFNGATGKISIDQNGDPYEKGIIVVQFQGDTPVFTKVIFP